VRGLVAVAVLVAAFSGGAYVALDGQGFDPGGAGGTETGRTPTPTPAPGTPRPTETRSPVWTPPPEPEPTPAPVTVEGE
jgi:hypothetical protein